MSVQLITRNEYKTVGSVSPGIEGTRTTTQHTTNQTSHSITLPSEITTGEMIFVFAVFRYGPSISINTGVSGNNWTLSTSVNYIDQVTAVYVYKIAEGSDALTLTTNDARYCSAISFRVSNATNVYSSSSSDTTATPDPASLTPGGGSATYVWIAANGAAASKTYSAYPDGYSNATTTTGTGSSDLSLATVDKVSTSASDDPSTFTLSSGAYNVTLTIAIK